MKKRINTIFLWVILILPYIGLFAAYRYYRNSLGKIQNAKVVLISKQEMNLRLFDYKGKEWMNIPIAIGLNPGNKEGKGDMKTPEGVFHISDIQKASDWKHDFKDGKGEIKGAYGPYFIRLNSPGHSGIGIHGTHLPESVGRRITEGCIRISNDNLLKLIPLIHPGTVVVITPGIEDISEVLNNRSL